MGPAQELSDNIRPEYLYKLNSEIAVNIAVFAFIIVWVPAISLFNHMLPQRYNQWVVEIYLNIV